VILDAIDGAIADYAVSRDAMRWTDSPLVDHFEVIVEAVRTDGVRVPLRLDGAVRVEPRCAFCHRSVVDANGDVRFTMCVTDGLLHVRCALPQGCLGRAAA
jgi:hypothetical protein